MAKFYRMVYALYRALGWAPLIIGYMTGWMMMELQPILGWSKVQIILACRVMVLLSTVFSGLLGVAYNQVFQLCFYLAGASLLVPYMLGYFGGWPKTVAAAVAIRGPQFIESPSAFLIPHTHDPGGTDRPGFLFCGQPYCRRGKHGPAVYGRPR